MQNETWLDLLQDYKFQLFSQNQFDQQTKGTPSRKIPAQPRKYWSRMNNFRKKEVAKQKAKGPTKRFSYDLGSPQLLDKKIEKFLPRLISGRVPKRGEEKEGVAVIFALRYKESGFGLCLNLMGCSKQGLKPKSTQISSFRGKAWKTHKWKIRVLRNWVFRLPKF